MYLARVFNMALYRAARTNRPEKPTPSLEAIRQSLARAERALSRAPIPAAAPSPVVRLPLHRPVESSPLRSPRTSADDSGMLLQEINGCKSLLMEIIRRAAYDWVLYRTSTRLLNAQLAEQAYNWLFVEGPGTKEWETRKAEGKTITSFVTICESLGLIPDQVRKELKRLTPKNVMSIGRPAEYRHRDAFPASADEDSYSLTDGHAEYDSAAAAMDDDGIY